MNKLFTTLLCMILSISAIAQQKIQLRSADKAECVKSDMNSLKASFSFSTIEAQDYESERGTFSWLSLPNTVIGGNEGDPQIPVVNQLIAVPFGATPRIEITSYSSTDYRLADYDMKTLVPRQLPVRKNQKPEDLPFIMNEAAYQTRGFRSEPMAVVGVEGTMRGIQLGKMTIEPVSYDPANNTIRVFNDIEVTVHFDNADAVATKQMLVDTYSPYFDIVYKSLFNGRAVMDAYTDHPDLYSTPVKMLVVTTSTFTSSTAFQNWLTWKKQKGIEVDVQEVTSSTTSANVRSLIQSRYNANHPTFLVIVGDESVVKNYTTWTDSDLNYSPYISDNAYASIDSDVYHDMYMSRMAVENTTQLGYLVNKILMYEKYTMTDPSYLNNVLLIAGWDSYWTDVAGKPTINYAATNYFNTAHGFSNVYKYITTASGQTTCYNYINNVGFVNYTAHGDIQEWYDPNFTNTNVNSLTNTGKPFWAMGNCCLTANWGNSSYSPCYGEAMIRANNKGAFGYIGSIPESYWFEDFYFGVGAFAAQQSSNNNPTVSGTTVGVYDAMFDETGFNCLNAVPYIGNVAVTYAHAKNYNSSVSDEYYWRGYQTLGDGSVMPYFTVPAANTVSHAAELQIGATSFTVSADAGSYVAITVNNEIIGVKAVDNTGTAEVTITPQTTTGTAMIVVTRNQRQPYITTIPITSSAEYTIAANTNPAAGGTIEGTGTYYENTECTLTATANHGYAFANWTLNNTVVSTNPSYTFTVNGNATYTANFTALTEHRLTYNPQQDHGTIRVSPENAYAGDVITLTATPDPNYRLDQWDVNTVGKGNVTVTNNKFIMPDSDVTISATFKSGYSITVLDLIGGRIEVSPTTAQPTDLIRLSVRANDGYEFMEWDVYETGNSTNKVTVRDDSFEMPEFDVTVSAVFGTPTQVQVENVDEIGTGTSTNQYIPTYNRSRYSLTEQIYTTTELGAAGTITGIEFYYSGNTARTRTLQVYMVSTTKSSFSSTTDWIKPTSSNMVYSGSVSFAARSWTTITFSTPFTYDGTSNVALIVDDNTGSTNNSAMNFYVYTASSNQAMYINGTTNYDPTSITSAASGRLGSKNRMNVHITRTETQILPLVCEEVPTNVTVSDATPEGATISWEGNADSYNIRYRTSSGFVYDFESAEPWVVDDFAPCTTYDGDRSATGGVSGTTFENNGYTGSFIAFQNGLSDNLSAHSGNAFGACFYATTPPNNDWFILPELTIQNGDVFTFWGRSLSSSYLESMRVGVYRADGTFSSYLAGSASASLTVPVEWTEYSYDLSAYDGQTIQLAINCNSNDKFALFIDDISVTNVGGNWDATITNVTSPYTLTGLSDETVYDVQVVGVCEGIGESEGAGSTFTTLSWCTAPTELGYYEVSASSATIGWDGYQESYNLQYRTAGGREEYLYTGFESGLPSDWTETNAGSNTGVYSGAPYSGTYMYGFVRNGTNDQYLITPELGDLEAGSLFAFYHLAYSADATIYIGYSSSTNATSDFTWGSAQTVTSSSAYDLYYEEIPTGTKYIAIRVAPVTSNAYYFIDDVMVVGPYVEPGEWHTASNVTSPYTINGLDSETEYEWQVQGVNCDGNGNTTNWSSESYFITLSKCDAPVELETSDITDSSATLNWALSTDEYNVRYAPVSYFEGFETGMTDWTVITNGEYLSDNFDEGWIDYAPSEIWSNLDAHSGYGAAMAFSYNPFGDEGVALTVDNWLISPQLDLHGYLKFWVMTNYDDPYEVLLSTTGTNTTDFTVTLLGQTTANYRVWTEVSIDLSSYEGQQGYIAIHHNHTDGYVLFIDDFGIYTEDWTTINNVDEPTLAITNLTAETDYVWQVQGLDCDGNGGETVWSSMDSFTTLEQTTITQTIELVEGANWFSTNVDITLNDLKAALVAATPNGTIKIKAKTSQTAYNPNNHRWTGTLAFDLNQMFIITVANDCEITLEGMPLDPTEHPITIVNGATWIGFPLNQTMTLTNAFAGFAVNGDQIKSKGGIAAYNRGRWQGTTLTSLEPGKGYIYVSQATEDRTLVFPTSAKVANKTSRKPLQTVNLPQLKESGKIQKTTNNETKHIKLGDNKIKTGINKTEKRTNIIVKQK